MVKVAVRAMVAITTNDYSNLANIGILPFSDPTFHLESIVRIDDYTCGEA